MISLELLMYTLLGLGGVIYALQAYRLQGNPLRCFPGPLRERKLAFAAGFLVMLIGFGLSWRFDQHFELISLFGAWGMLLGGAQWFNQRHLRRAFAPSEWKIIRITLFSGLLVMALSTGLFYFPRAFAPGTMLIGLALILVPGRLWWRSSPDVQ
ncbi:MAG: hypothetical protein RBU29_15390 [bacterium]|jgi:hypothetical protein|nr:hypothetical protein [bacterium]